MKIKLAIVSYHNTLPFLAGLESEKYKEHFEVIKAIPADCARLFQEGKVDVSLVPVGGLHLLKDFDIITDYCIGCEGAVYTVALMSDTPIESCKTLYLDSDSMTSIRLAVILLKEYMGLELEIVSGLPSANSQVEKSAVLMIGDKVFENEARFVYKYDLGQLWQEFTGLPFAFAVWLKTKAFDRNVETLLNEVFDYGINHSKAWNGFLVEDKLSLQDYLTNYISFEFDEKKKQAMALFQSKLLD